MDGVRSAYVWLVAMVAAASGLLFGFDIAVINGALLFLRQQFGLTEFQTEIAASSLLIGCVVGSAVAGWLSDRYGRRGILKVAALLFGISAIGAALPRTLEEFTAARFVGGIAIGVASLLAPLYIAEVSPPRIRGRLVSLNQMAIVTGILLAYLVNWLLSYFGPSSWRWMFASAAVPSAALFLALFFVPESPRWLAEFGMGDAALAVLTRVAGPKEAMLEMQQIEESLAEEKGTIAELFQPGLRTALTIAVVLAVLQQFTGINTVLFYGSIIFKEQLGNNSVSAAIGANVAVGIINFLSTIVAVWIIDRVGRKALLMFSAAVMAVSEIGMGIGFHMLSHPSVLLLTLIGVCVAGFAIGLGPGVWVVLSEIFPTRVRGRAMSIATVALWIACVVLTLTFLSLVTAIGISGAFWLYAGLCVLTFFFVWFVTPETKGKTLEEIGRFWKR